MFKAIGAAALLLLGLAQPAVAAHMPSLDRRIDCQHQWQALPPADPGRAAGHRTFLNRCQADCPDGGARDTDKTYGAPSRDYCEVRWTGLVHARRTGGETRDEFIESCAKRCSAKREGPSGPTLALIAAGLGAAGGAVAAGGVGGKDATSDPPPASP